MKTFKLLSLVFTVSIATSSWSYSQQGGLHASAFLTGTLRETFSEQNLLEPIRVNVRATRDFIRRFSRDNASWYVKNDTSLAIFTNDSVTTIAGYAKNGRWLYTVKNFGEKLLPANLRHAIRSQYYDYRINSVYELQFPANTEKVYIMYLKDDAGQNRMLRVYNDDVVVIRQFRS